MTTTSATRLTESEIRDRIAAGLEAQKLTGKRVLVIVPDGTRSGPLGVFFRALHDLLSDSVAALDFLIALGTHQPMSREAICRRLDVSAEELDTRYSGVQILNHEWGCEDTFRTIGTISAREVEELSRGLLSVEIPVRINRMIDNYDQLMVCGPVFPHEVAGFS